MKVSKNQLQEALSIVQPGLTMKGIMEQADSFAFIGDKVVTYNDRISISHPVEGLDIRGAIYSVELYKLLQKITKDEIDISVKKNEVSLKFGKGLAHLTLQSEIRIPIIEVKEKWEELPDNFNHFLKFAMGACSNDMSQPELTCVNIQDNGIIQATDSYKIFYCELGDEIPAETFLLPASSAKEVAKINPTYISKSKEWVHFKNEQETVISCRLENMDKEYPDLKKHIASKGEQIAFPSSTTDLIDKAWIFAKRKNELDEEIRIDIRDKKMTVSSRSETGSFSEKTPIRYGGSPIEFVIAPYLLVDILKETNKGVLSENAIKFEDKEWQYVSVLDRRNES
jgi:hypothetical protein